MLNHKPQLLASSGHNHTRLKDNYNAKKERGEPFRKSLLIYHYYHITGLPGIAWTLSEGKWTPTVGSVVPWSRHLGFGQLMLKLSWLCSGSSMDC